MTLRLAMSSFYLPSESKIGAGYMAHRLAQVMVDRGHQVTMFSPSRRPDDARYDHTHVVQTGSMRTVRWPFRLRQLDLSGFDVYHAHGDDHLRIGRPTPAHVRTIHGSCFSEAIHIHGVKERVRMVGLGFTEVAATAVADVSVAVSQNTRTYYPWVRRVIPNGVALDRFHPGAKEDRPTILFVGTYEQRKRGRLLMEAFRNVVRPAVPDAQLWMVCTDAPAADGVEVLGTVSEDDLADRYRRAWVFCLPSSYEGFGVPYIEALASGTAVVATPNPGAREVLAEGRFGVLTEPEALGAALVALLQDQPHRSALATSGLQRAQAFSWDQVASQYEAIYSSAIERHGRG